MIAPIPSRFALASTLVDLWNYPHSGRYLRFAAHAAARAGARLGDVLELGGAGAPGKEHA